INRRRFGKLLNLLKGPEGFIAVLIQTTNSGLNLLLVDGRPEAADQRRTYGGTRSGNTNNSTSLQRPASSGGHTGPHRPARALSHFRDGFVDRRVKLRGKLACRGENANIGSPKLHGHMYPRLCPTRAQQRPTAVLPWAYFHPNHSLASDMDILVPLP